jgi:predicted ATP-grasp superfamily ATP-dependent carboligase
MHKKSVAVVTIGGYVNGYNIIRELHDANIPNILLIDYTKSIASYSNKIKDFFLIKRTPTDLLETLQRIHEEYEYIVLYPTDDYTIEMLIEIYRHISQCCFVPFNIQTIAKSLDKSHQYKICTDIGIPIPQTITLTSIEDLQLLSTIQFPIIVKPLQRNDISNTTVFRSKQYTSIQETETDTILQKLFQEGYQFIASEIIPGDGSNIYAYTAYRDTKGIIKNEWIGKKLSQYPNDFGVFSSAANEAPEIIREYGKKLLHALDVYGIAEPEFKYDARDNTYKLMEVNLRSMMWHRLGNRSGVTLQLTQYKDALGQQMPTLTQDMSTRTHFVYMKHELINLCTRPRYYKTFFYNLHAGEITTWAVFDTSDIRPAIVDSIRTIAILSKSICKRLLFR